MAWNPASTVPPSNPAPDEPDPDAVPPPRAPNGRYTKLRYLGCGSMGEVWLARDWLLGRDVAMKFLHERLLLTPGAVERFSREARLLAQLQHPDLTPLYDHGYLPDDPRPMYTMRLIEGEPMSVHLRAGAAISQRELVSMLQRVALAVAYAHDRGVLHRDLKPDNIMLGTQGAVSVIDWGLGVSKGEARGRVGTPGYWAPEITQDARADVYSLGACLYHVLTGQRHQEPEPPEPPAPMRAHGPDELVELVRHATEPAPEDRPPTARAFADAINDWLKGARAKDRAQASVIEAREKGELAQRLRDEAAALRARAAEALSRLRGWDPVERKVEPWRLERASLELECDADRAEQRQIQLLQAAIAAAPGATAAPDELAQVWIARHQQATRTRDERAMVVYEQQLRDTPSPRVSSYLQGRGALRVQVDARDATYNLDRYVERDGRLQPEPYLRGLPTGPTLELDLPAGSYLLRVLVEGRDEVACPVLIERDMTWTGAPAGESGPGLIRPPRVGALGPRDCFVPAGPAWLGGDPLAQRSRPATQIWGDDLIIRRHPVTYAEYIHFLNDLVASGARDRAEALQPRNQGEATRGRPLLGFDQHMGYHLVPDDDGYILPADAPVAFVGALEAEAYAAWAAARDRLPWRLPTQTEREKAARGVDGRLFPWGDRFDPAFCNMGQSRRRAEPVSVRTPTFDVSPYGVHGLSGGVVEFTSSFVDGAGVELRRDLNADRVAQDMDGVLRVAMGAAYFSAPFLCRSASRALTDLNWRSAGFGFRLVRAAP